MSFHSILREMLQSTPGAIGAVFLDQEGEAVETWAESVFDIGPEGLRAIGAYEGIFLSDLKRASERMAAGKLQRLTIEFEHAKVLSCDLKEGYYLVLVVASDANEGIAWQHLRVCRERLIKEL
ncbi:MAG: GTPase-activating protein [Acidobacteria bacterium]|nr:MAG: GTPase-activating protein [Acidobacteriota bacterium]